jgi:hypothetical protein
VVQGTILDMLKKMPCPPEHGRMNLMANNLQVILEWTDLDGYSQKLPIAMAKLQSMVMEEVICCGTLHCPN